MDVNINLIPESKKKQIERARHMKLVIKTEVGISLLLFVLFSFTLSLNRTLDINLNTVDANQQIENNQADFKEINDYEQSFTEINNAIKDINMIKKDQIYWSKLLIKLSGHLVSGVKITDLATSNFSVFLVGKADNRDNLIEFKDKLSKEDCFSDVNLPLSDLVAQRDIDFQLDFNIKSDCLRGL